mgnify:CR=1 FL=1
MPFSMPSSSAASALTCTTSVSVVSRKPDSVSSLTVPVVTLIAFLTGNELQFGLGAPEMIVMVASLLLCQISFSTGRTNVLNGAAHLALFAAYLMTIFA